MQISLSGAKTAGGDETPRFEASLVVDGAKVAVVSNGGTGGPCSYHWAASARRDAVLAHAVIVATTKHPDLASFYAQYRNEALDAVVYELLETQQLQRRLKRAATKSTLFRLKGDARGTYRTLNRPHSTAVVEGLRQKHGARLACVLNDMSETERAERVLRAED